MNFKTKHRTSLRNRVSRRGGRGSVVVEAALLLPFLILVNFGAIDTAQFINSGQVVSNASREGARVGSKNQTKSVSEVEAAVRQFMHRAMPQLSQDCQAISVDVYNSDGTKLSGNELSGIESGDPVSVKVDFDFDAVRWLTFVSLGDHSITTHFRRD